MVCGLTCSIRSLRTTTLPPAGRVGTARSASYITRGFADQYEAVDINGLRQIFLVIPPGTGESPAATSRW